MKVLELFGGIGACTQALKRFHIPLEIADYVEIDKYAVKSYNAINGTNFEPQDITKWDKDIEVDLIMHGSPCQDFSIAGKQRGADEGSGTRSSLMYETVRIVTKLKPKYVIWENVKNVLSAKHRHNFDAYLEKMQALGYENFYQVLNAKDYEIPQNRERIFTVSILNGGDFSFPLKKELKTRLKDVLEDEVDEKYYLSDEQVEKIKTSTFTQERKRIQENDYCDTLLARDWKDPKCVQVGSLSGGKWDKMHEQSRRVYSGEGLAPTVHTCGGGNTEPKVLIKTANKKGYDEAVEGDSVNLQYPDSKTRRGRVGHGVSQTLQCDDSMGVVTAAAMRGRENGQQIEISDREYSNALTTVQKDSLVVENLRIRKLTPKECWRLMGFSDECFDKASKVNSNTQLYKQAGNSIVVDVLVHIFRNLLLKQHRLYKKD